MKVKYIKSHRLVIFLIYKEAALAQGSDFFRNASTALQHHQLVLESLPPLGTFQSSSSGNDLKVPSRGQDSSRNTEVPMSGHPGFVHATNFTQKSKQALQPAAYSLYTH